METTQTTKERRTFSGRFFWYESKRVVGQDGTHWIQVVVIDVNGTALQRFHVPTDDMEAFYKALGDAAGSRTEGCTSLEKRPFPEAVELLRGRNAGKAWGNGEEALLVHLFHEGYSPSEIMTLLGRSHGSITARLTQMGFMPELVVPQYDYRRSMAD